MAIIWDLIKKSVQNWNNDNAAQLAAAIAYYTIFSIPPLLIITLAIASYFFTTDIAQKQLFDQLNRFIGSQSADFIKSLLNNSTQSSSITTASIISLIVLLAGASGVFNQMQTALNTIWKVPKQQSHSFLRAFNKRLLSFLMVLAIGFLLLVFLLISAFLSVLIGSLNQTTQNTFLPEAVNFLVLFILMTLMTALIFRVIPDREISWTDVWLGAAVTSFLFMLGRYAIGLYLSISRSASTFGAAGSLIVLLIWIYYSAQIFLLGAEFTCVYSRKIGSHTQDDKKSPSMVENIPSPKKI